MWLRLNFSTPRGTGAPPVALSSPSPAGRGGGQHGQESAPNPLTEPPHPADRLAMMPARRPTRPLKLTGGDPAPTGTPEPAPTGAPDLGHPIVFGKAAPLPASPRRVASVEVGAETETGSGWRYAVTLEWLEGGTTDHELTLGWHDHDHWSGGAAAPSKVAAAVARVAGDALGREKLPRRFDASTVRRVVADADGRIQRLV